MGARKPEMDGYVRVSRRGGREGDGFISPREQRAAIKRWADAHGVRISAWHEDVDWSGGTMNRPGMTEAIDRIRAGVTGGIVVAKLDRFARSMPKGLATIAEIEDMGGRVRSAAEDLDEASPSGRAFRAIMMVFAQWELDRRREDWASAQADAVRRGIHIASMPPTGYRRGADRRLEAIDEYREAIRQVFELRAAGTSWTRLAEHLTAAGVVGPYGSPQWTSRAVDHLVRNRVYLGEARSGRHVNRAAHEPLVSEATWQAAQRAVGVRPGRSSEPFLLAGLLRCAGCRTPMKPSTQKNRDGSVLRGYRCRAVTSGGRCEDRAFVVAHLVEPVVIAAALERAAGIAEVGAERSGDLRALELAVEAASRELEAWEESALVSEIGVDAYARGVALRERRRDEAHAALAAARPTSPVGGVRVELADAWPELDVDERRLVFASLIDAVMVRSGRTAIMERLWFFWSGELPEDFPRRGRRVPLAPFAWPVGTPLEVGPASGEDGV